MAHTTPHRCRPNRDSFPLMAMRRSADLRHSHRPARRGALLWVTSVARRVPDPVPAVTLRPLDSPSHHGNTSGPNHSPEKSSRRYASFVPTMEIDPSEWKYTIVPSLKNLLNRELSPLSQYKPSCVGFSRVQIVIIHPPFLPNNRHTYVASLLPRLSHRCECRSNCDRMCPLEVVPSLRNASSFAFRSRNLDYDSYHLHCASKVTYVQLEKKGLLPKGK